MNFDAQSSLRLIAEALNLVDSVGGDPIVARHVRMAESTLVVEVLAQSEEPIRLRGSIAAVMGALSGLDVPALFPALNVRFFGVRAFGSGGNELLWIVSSLEAATLAARGQPIEWLSRSVVQDNTADHRRSLADRTIGQVEIALRDLLEYHAGQPADGRGIEQLLPKAALKQMRQRASGEGVSGADLRSVLDYAYLTQLADAILARPEWFDDGCVPDCDVLREAVGVLNRVRRKVAHHRTITADEVDATHKAADAVLGPLGHTHPVFACDFLAGRWDDEVEGIISAAQRTIEAPLVPEAGTVPERGRRAAAIGALQMQLAGIESARASLERLIVPAQRRDLHRLALLALGRWSGALEALVDVGGRPNLSLAEARTAQAEYESALGEVREFREKIRAIRVGLSSNGV